MTLIESVMCSIKVRFSRSREARGVLAHALKVEVLSSEGISPKIFVYHQLPAGIDGNTFAEFDHVATPVDLHEIPEDAASDIVPWYRTDTCTVWLRAESDLDMARQMFVDDIHALRRSFDSVREDKGFEGQTTLEFSDRGVHRVE